MNRFCKSFEQESWAPLGLGGAPPASEAGFSWGYADLLDPAGSGVVIIWAHGLPFAPGILSRERAGTPVRASAAPSLSIAAYDKGNPVFWLLRDLRPEEAVPHAPGGFGGVRISRTDGALALELDVPVPGAAPLQGAVSIEGTDVVLGPAGPALHRWAPQLVGRAKAELRCGDAWSLAFEGRGYHDRNASSLGLTELGIRRWIWGRTPHEDGETVHYLVEPVGSHSEQNHVLEIDWSGAVEHRFVEVERSAEVRGRWGVPSPRQIRAGDLQIAHDTAVEDGPFYQRWLTSVSRGGATHRGVGEVVDVDRIDRGWAAPLVRMAPDGPNASIWSPLFVGPSAGGAGRLFRSWRARWSR